MNARDRLVVVPFLFGFLDVVMMIERGMGGGDVVVFGVLMMGVREVGVMAREFVLAFGVMLMRGVVMLRGFLVMHRGERMVFGGGLGVFHGVASWLGAVRAPNAGWLALDTKR